MKFYRKIYLGIENSQYKVLKWEYTWNRQKIVNKPVWVHHSEQGEQTEMKAKWPQDKITKNHW